MTARHYFDKNHARVTSAVLHARTSMLIVGFATGVFALYDLPGGGRADTAALAALMDADGGSDEPPNAKKRKGARAADDRAVGAGEQQSIAQQPERVRARLE